MDTTTDSLPPRKKDFLPRELINVSRRAGKAIMDYAMIADGDRIAVAVSGGKDSLSLMHVLRHRRRICPIHFDLTAMHIDFGLSDFDPEPLMTYLREQGFDCHREKVPGLEGERYEDMDCYRWSTHRRKALFQICERMGYNKIALGHHMDDIVETILLNQFYRGEIGAMKPKQELFEGKITIIRPLAYERESRMVALARALKIDTMGQSKCSYDDISHRMLIKNMLRQFEADNPAIVKNVFRSLQNIRIDYLLETACDRTNA